MSGGNLLNRIKDQVNKAQNRQTSNQLLFLDSKPDNTTSSSSSTSNFRYNPHQLPSNTRNNIQATLMGKTASYGSYANMHSNDLFEDFNATTTAAASMNIINRTANNTNNPNKQQQSRASDYAATIRHNNYMSTSFNNTIDTNDTEGSTGVSTVLSTKYRSKSQNQTAGSSVIASLKDSQESMREAEQLEEASRNESNNRFSPQNKPTGGSVLFDKTALMRRQDKLKGSAASVVEQQNIGRAYLKVNEMLEQQQQQQLQQRGEQQEEEQQQLRRQQKQYQYNFQETQLLEESQKQQVSKSEQQFSQVLSQGHQQKDENNVDGISAIIALIDTTIIQAANSRQSLLLQLQSVQGHNQDLRDEILTHQQNQTEMRALLQQKDQERRMAQAALQQAQIEAQEQGEQQQQQQQLQQQQKDSPKDPIPRQPRKSSNSHAIPEDFSSLLRIIENLTEENKSLRNKNELLQYENDKAIELARRAKNNKAMSDLNNIIEFSSPAKSNQNANHSGISNGLNDTFIRRKQQQLSGSNTSSNSKINNNDQNMNIIMHGNLHNVSQIPQYQNPSLNTSTNDILKKLNLNDSSFSSNQAALSNTKKKFKYLQPKK